MNILKTAQVAHEVNRAWCAANGDMSQPAWEDAPEWQRESAVMGVEFHINNPNANDSASHDSWLAQKYAEGWVYGEVKNPDAVPPTHPCIVPFNQLPRVDQIKDALFRSTIHAIHEQETSGLTVTDVKFNPGGNPLIENIKVKANALADAIGFVTHGRRRSVALTKLEEASMWAVKAAACGDA